VPASSLEVKARPSPPVCSVVVCAYNSRHRIDTALDSLRAQDFTERFEVLAVISGDDGCAEYVASHHPTVRVVRSRHRLYPGAARNAGINASSGTFIAFLPDDCVADPGWLRARVTKHRLGYPLVGGAVSNGTPRSLVGTASYYVEYAASMPFEGLLERQPIPHTVSYHRDVFEQVGRFPEVDYPGEDTLFNASCIAAGLTVAYEPRAAIAHRNLTSISDFLAHQMHHGLGHARCVVEQNLEGPFDVRDTPCRTAYVALVGYPTWRWHKTLGLLTHTTPGHLVRFLALTPLAAAAYLVAGLAALREIRRGSSTNVCRGR
jgi:cellulose synthase/poly-beta-1,6-N-acetylglucosamine synthase-like glycosyltransferase